MVGPLFAVTAGAMGRSHSMDGESRLRLPGIRPRPPRLALRRSSIPLRVSRSAGGEWPWGRVRTEASNAPGSAASAAVENERELLIVVHGLQGAVGDFNYVMDKLRATAACKSGKLIIYAPRVNTDNTHDGVAAGGKRIADDTCAAIRRAADRGTPFHRLSLLGFSLGGLYARYAAAVLFEPRDRTFAGLRPGSIVLVASPHLGVRRFGLYRFMPGAVRGARLFSDTVREMMMMDDDKILQRMTRDDPVSPDGSLDYADQQNYNSNSNRNNDNNHNNHNNTNINNINNHNRNINNNSSGSNSTTKGGKKMLFVSALQAFELRVLYANVRNDFMVNFGTGALEPGVAAINGHELDRVMRGTRRCAVDAAHDERGCRVCFRYWVDGEGDGGTADDGGSEMVFSKHTKREGAEEVVMAQRLRSIGWWIVGVDFPMALPIAHNRIVAMSRNIIHAWLNAPGQRVVHHLVDTMCNRYHDHEPLFRRTDTHGDVMDAMGDSTDDDDDDFDFDDDDDDHHHHDMHNRWSVMSSM